MNRSSSTSLWLKGKFYITMLVSLSCFYGWGSVATTHFLLWGEKNSNIVEITWYGPFHFLASDFRGFLQCSRGNSQKFADLSKLARRFFELNPESATSAPNGPTKAYVEEVVEAIRRGEILECPICMESADDPVLTPCAHRMCRECLLSSWRSPAAGLCPLCRQMVRKTDLITCPSESRFHVDVEKNWKESSKISSLLNCLERIRHSGTGEKSIVFSQWTTFLDLLEIPLKREGIGYLRYDGGLTQKQREKVLYEFNENKEKMVKHFKIVKIFPLILHCFDTFDAK